jgi:hypothetical protein
MEGPIRPVIIWIISVVVIIAVLFGLRAVILRQGSPRPEVAKRAFVTPSPAFGNPPKQWGVFANAFQISDRDDAFSPAKVDATILVLKDLGVNAILLPYEALTATEPNDAVNDVTIKKFSDAGLTIILLCCDGFEFGETNRYAKAFDFAARLGEKYRERIEIFQFLNEISGTAIKPGHSGFVFEDYEGEKYLEIRELLRGLTDGLASTHPRAKRLISAHWLGIGIVDQLIKDRVSFEIVGWHWFSDMGPDPVKIPLSTDRGVPAEFNGQIFNLPAHFTEQGKEFWITETNLERGSLDGKEYEQATYLENILKVVAETEEVTGFFYFRLTDGAENAGTSAWGLYQTKPTSDGSSLEYDRPKEAYQIYKQFLAKQQQEFVLPFDPRDKSR